ncbi:MAG: DUF3883 domain-containing protein [Nitrospira sp.]|jgi:hypothetical protein|nr:DUF3883 domain-containing protein [Nitrospira sp.]
MQINNETRKEPKSAREVLERLLPDARLRNLCLRYLCDSIQLTHQFAPSSWGLTLQKDMVRLNVGQIEVLTVGQARVHVVFDRNDEPQDLRDLPGVQIDPKTPLYESVNSSAACDFPASQANSVLPLIRASHHQLVKQAVETPRHNMTARAHSPGMLRYLEEEVGILLSNPDYAARSKCKLSALIFQAQFERFKKALLASSGEEFHSFREGLPLAWEGYKEHVRTRARTLLKFSQWTDKDIGTGLILDRVIEAIEINEGATLRNNLVAWQPRYGPKRVPQWVLKEARQDKAKRSQLERAFYDLFRTDKSEKQIFEFLGSLGVSHYDLMAYLFFLKDWDRFMPISTTNFDKAFRDLGIELRTTRQCSWDNYCSYNEALHQVLVALRDVTELEDVRLIDAHSFCWILVRLKPPAAAPGPIIPLPKVLAGLQAEPVKAGEPITKTKFDKVDEEEFGQRDAARRRLGKLAQDIAMLSEQKRLREAGHPSPEEAVQAVWNEPGRGYDIHSCELDGTDRYIEVKAARQSGQKLSFFLTQNEWKQSRSKSNYCFYLVIKVESGRPEVLVIRSGEVSPDCLAPVNYSASLRFPSN